MPCRRNCGRGFGAALIGGGSSFTGLRQAGVITNTTAAPTGSGQYIGPAAPSPSIEQNPASGLFFNVGANNALVANIAPSGSGAFVGPTAAQAAAAKAAADKAAMMASVGKQLLGSKTLPGQVAPTFRMAAPAGKVNKTIALATSARAKAIDAAGGTAPRQGNAASTEQGQAAAFAADCKAGEGVIVAVNGRSLCRLADGSLMDSAVGADGMYPCAAVPQPQYSACSGAGGAPPAAAGGNTTILIGAAALAALMFLRR